MSVTGLASTLQVATSVAAGFVVGLVTKKVCVLVRAPAGTSSTNLLSGLFAWPPAAPIWVPVAMPSLPPPLSVVPLSAVLASLLPPGPSPAFASGFGTIRSVGVLVSSEQATSSATTSKQNAIFISIPSVRVQVAASLPRTRQKARGER